MIKIGINGFGRIGMLTAKRMKEQHPSLGLVAINDVYPVRSFTSNGVKFFQEKDPSVLPWKELGVDIVLECSGFFTEIDGAAKHITAGSRKVIISAPSDSEDIPTYLLGINQEKYNSQKDNIISMGSCTTNAVAPVASIADKVFGIEAGFVNTIHSYTNSQNKLYPSWRSDAASQLSIIPSTTGATKTVEKCLPQLKAKLNGLSLRVPTETVSIVEFVFLVKKKATAQQVNEALEKASQAQAWKNILKFENKKLISNDLKGSEYSSIVDGTLTQTFGKLIRVFAWYDNEWGYCCRLAEMAEYIGKQLF
ncbi:MAG: glyceraldehyde 3-phosphate dehydrogenase NAD-binding domain-containing protein [Candidatus Pacebacteria bacterium]|nr:glyceraldehyde 3-phosphate dehydrogenase NAD-binding domain-containing protein [Candidatus Paceibacterota bacterium]